MSYFFYVVAIAVALVVASFTSLCTHIPGRSRSRNRSASLQA